MAAGAWTFYGKAKEFIGDGTIDLDTDNFRISLYTSASNASSPSGLTSLGSVTNEIADGNGYSTSGHALASVTWGAGASGLEKRWDAADPLWTASGGSIANIKFAVIWASGGQLLAFSKLSTSQFTVTDTNTLTITISANGIFELN